MGASSLLPGGGTHILLSWKEGRSPCSFCVQKGGLVPHRVSTDNMVGKALAPLGNGRSPDSPPGLF